MKKIFTLLCCVIAASSVYSQARVGIKGGLNISNMHFKEKTVQGKQEDNGSSMAGAQVGLISDIRITKGLHFRPELLFVTKGSKLSEGDNNMKLTPSYIELPLSLVYYREGRGINFYVGGGPALAVGVAGKVKLNNAEADFFGNNKAFKRFDLGLNLVAGIDLPGGFTAGINFNQGLLKVMDIQTVMSDGPTIGEASLSARNVAFGVTVGYFFHNKK